MTLNIPHSNIDQEQRTVGKMIALYCRAHHHSTPELCPECSQVLEYAQKRIAACQFQPDKPTCGKCPVHCYRADMREKIRQVMRFSGPRLLLRDPVATFRHLAQTVRKPSDKVLQAMERKAQREAALADTSQSNGLPQ